MMSAAYTITVTEQQARTISAACELLARLGMGQWPEMLHHLPMQPRKRGGDHISALLPYMAGLLDGGIDGWRSRTSESAARERRKPPGLPGTCTP